MSREFKTLQNYIQNLYEKYKDNRAISFIYFYSVKKTCMHIDFIKFHVQNNWNFIPTTKMHQMISHKHIPYKCKSF